MLHCFKEPHTKSNHLQREKYNLWLLEYQNYEMIKNCDQCACSPISSKHSMVS